MRKSSWTSPRRVVDEPNVATVDDVRSLTSEVVDEPKVTTVDDMRSLDAVNERLIPVSRLEILLEKNAEIVAEKTAAAVSVEFAKIIEDLHVKNAVLERELEEKEKELERVNLWLRCEVSEKNFLKEEVDLWRHVGRMELSSPSND